MKIGIVVVAFTIYPKLVFDSIIGNTAHEISWFVHCHGQDATLEHQLSAFCLQQSCDLRLHRWNRGLARSWNDGILASYAEQNDVTLVVNDDVAFRPGAFDAFISFLDTSAPFALGFLYGAEPNEDGDGIVETNEEFSCFAFGRLAFEKIGAFDENIFPAYVEDSDYITRVRTAGLPIVTDRRVLVDHERSKTLKSSPALRARIYDAWNLNHEYYKRKWGVAVNSGPTFNSAFNESGLFISWENRRAPFGARFDRPDLPTDRVPRIQLRSLVAEGGALAILPDEAQAAPEVDVSGQAGQFAGIDFEGGTFLHIIPHVAGRGDMVPEPGAWAGEPGSALPIEGITCAAGVDIAAFGILYQTVLQDGTLSPSVEMNGYCGTRGQSLPIFGVRFLVQERFADRLMVIYEAHFVDGTVVGPVAAPKICAAPSHVPLEAIRAAFKVAEGR